MQEDRSVQDRAQPPERDDATLPRSAILRGRTTFSAVFDSGNGTRVGRLVVKYQVVPGDATRTLAGFVMRRGSGNAVRRNRLKRLMREAWRHERRRVERQLPDGLELRLVLLWSGTREDAPLEHLDRIRADLSGALRKIVHRLRPRQDER